MKRIYKYPVDLDEVVSFLMPKGVSFLMPKGAQILSVQSQNDRICFWALVDTNAEIVPRRFRVVGTGHPADDVTADTFVGTVQMRAGAIVLHVFAVLS